MKKKILMFLLSLFVITIGMNYVNAEPQITLDNLKLELEKSEIMKKYNAKMKIETNTLFIDTNNIRISFNYDLGNLIYSMDNNVALYAIDQSIMTEDEFLAKSKESMAIASEVVACVADLYGYNMYHNDWLGNMFLNDYANNGVYYKVDNINKMAILYELKLDLNGTFKAYLDKIASNQQNSNQITDSNNGTQNIVDSTENNNQATDSNNGTQDVVDSTENNNQATYSSNGTQDVVDSTENNNQVTDSNESTQEKNDKDELEKPVENSETSTDKKYYIITFGIIFIIAILVFNRKNSLQKI